MIYRNTKTGAVIETYGTINGGEWVEVKQEHKADVPAGTPAQQAKKRTRK